MGEAGVPSLVEDLTKKADILNAALPTLRWRGYDLASVDECVKDEKAVTNYYQQTTTKYSLVASTRPTAQVLRSCSLRLLWTQQSPSLHQTIMHGQFCLVGEGAGWSKISRDSMDRTRRIFKELRKSNSSLATWELKSSCIVGLLCPISHGTHKNSAFLTSQPQLQTRGKTRPVSCSYIGNWWSTAAHLSQESGTVCIVVKLAFDAEQQYALRSEYKVSRRLRSRFYQGIATTLGFLDDSEGAACTLVMFCAGVGLSSEVMGNLSISEWLVASRRPVWFTILIIHDFKLAYQVCQYWRWHEVSLIPLPLSLVGWPSPTTPFVFSYLDRIFLFRLRCFC